MGTSDGTVGATTKIVDNGTDTDKLVIAVVGDGYLNSDLSQFANDVDDLVATLFATPPFNQPRNQQAFNVYRVDVTSDERGADDPATCSGGAGSTAATYFDSSYCWDGAIRRLLSADATIVSDTLDAQVPEWDQALVIVNSPVRGGAGGQIAVSANGGSDWKEVVVHELGHSLFGLADEYDSYAGCGSGETGHDTHPGPEPDQPNVTLNSNRTTIKWAHHIDPTTTVPTMSNPDCSECDDRGSTVSAGIVGAFEGAKYYHCGAYRPEYECIMRRSAFGSFCTVCEEQICKVLAPYATSVSLAEPSIVFHDVPEGVTAPGSAVFNVDNVCATIDFEIIDGPRVLTGSPGTVFGTEFGLSFDSAPVLNPRSAYVWVTYTGTADGDTATGEVRIRCVETEQEFWVPISANTVARPSVAVELVLDKSASMGYSSGIPGLSREDVLRFSAAPFVDVLPEGNAVGIVSFDHNAYIVMPVSGPTGPMNLPDMTRINARNEIVIHSHNPAGMTAIGDGLEAAHNELAPVTGYDVKATIVLTDGHETADKRISQVTDLIDERVYAIGLGTAEQIQPAALTAVTNGTGGYTLVTGDLGLDQYFRLTKYYLQILAGVRNADVVLDPEGFLRAGAEHRIEFTLAETDIDSDVILLSPLPQVIGFHLETPNGHVIAPGSGAVGVTHAATAQGAYYRVTLPALVGVDAEREGTWTAVLSVDEALLKRYLEKYRGSDDPRDQDLVSEVDAHGVRYAVNVYAFTNLRLRATLTQTSFEPGATMAVRALMTEYGLPMAGRAVVTATVQRPDGTSFAAAMPESAPGVFDTSFLAETPGVYTVRLQAVGHTLRGRPFQREQVATGAVWVGDQDPGHGDGGRPGGGEPGGGRDAWCQLLACLLSEDVLSIELRERLRKRGLNVDVVRRCLVAWCRGEAPRSPVLLDPQLVGVVEALTRLVREQLRE